LSIVPNNEGFLLLDVGLNLIASNDSALQILCFPSVPEQIMQPKVFLAGRVRTLIDRKNREGPLFVKELKSGKRRYICKSFQVGGNELYPIQPAFALLLERRESSGCPALAEIAEQFNLTQRECETVEFILQGLTSKEIATRMKISPNTVKAFLRLVMVKMKVSTRSGIAGKIAGSRHGILPGGVQLDAQRNSMFRKQSGFYRQTHSDL
jgi:DNA-binding CsgD family transcriptional regulator